MSRIPRRIFPRFLAELDRPEISILLGPRQVGKTYLLRELEKRARRAGRPTRYYNLELPHDLKTFSGTPADIFNLLTERPGVVFIDEFHYLENASKIFKAVFDSGKGVKIFASGSSAMGIHRHLKESLAGRRLTTYLSPLDFNEFLRKDGKADRPQALAEFLAFGGLPGLLHAEDRTSKIRLLNEILETYIQKDVKSLIREENVRAFNNLLYLLAESQGSIISENSLSREVGLTAVTVGRHLTILENTYVCRVVHSFARRMGNELKKSKKVYLYDIGVRNALLKDFSSLRGREDAGAVRESYVFSELEKRRLPDVDIRFWRSRAGQEIDFLVVRDRKAFLIEVKSGLKRPEVPRAFNVFIKHYPETLGGLIVSDGLNEKVRFMDKEIRFVSLDKLPGALDQWVFADRLPN